MFKKYFVAIVIPSEYVPISNEKRSIVLSANQESIDPSILTPVNAKEFRLVGGVLYPHHELEQVALFEFELNTEEEISDKELSIIWRQTIALAIVSGGLSRADVNSEQFICPEGIWRFCEPSKNPRSFLCIESEEGQILIDNMKLKGF